LEAERSEARRGLPDLGERAVDGRQGGAVDAAHLAAGLAVVLLEAPEWTDQTPSASMVLGLSAGREADAM